MPNYILVTGANGFIGRHVVKQLHSAGYQIYGIDICREVIDGTLIDPLDLTDRSQILAWCKGKKIEAIVHLAAIIPTDGDRTNGQDIFKQNIIATQNILAMAKYSSSYVIFASSSSVYGMMPRQDLPLTESSPVKPDSFYSFSKYTGEILGEQLCMNGELKFVGFRVSSPYGPGNKRNTVINRFLNAAILSEDITLFGKGERTQDFIYVDDIVNIVQLALEKQLTGIYNLASGKPISMKTLADVVLKTFPDSLSRVTYLSEEDPQENYRGCFSIVKLQQALNWEPGCSLLYGLNKTASWLREK